MIRTQNALTGISLGAGKGGSDFDPKGKSDGEVMRFCQSFMTELSKHIGPNTDVPAGDIGVGAREIGYMFGQYKRLTRRFEGVLTGKGESWGGSLIRPEATGYGVVYFVECMLRDTHAASLKDKSMVNKRVAISGSGNVAQFATEKLLELGATVLTLSDSDGTVYAPNGIDYELLREVMEHKNVRRGRLSELPSVLSNKVKFFAGEKPWAVTDFSIALPCATQNELDERDADALIAGGCGIVAEGANMPITPAAHARFSLAGSAVAVGPAKAANAGGVAVSGLEMAQNASFLQWTRQDVDSRLKNIMENIYAKSMSAAEDVGRPGDLRSGADIAGFRRVADAMDSQGCV